MRTTLEVPDSLFRQVKALTASRGQTMAAFINSAIESKLKADAATSREKPWLQFAGIHSDDREDSKRVMRAIEEGCETIDPEQWR